jgi:hypothetical protein
MRETGESKLKGCWVRKDRSTICCFVEGRRQWAKESKQPLRNGKKWTDLRSLDLLGKKNVDIIIPCFCPT